MKTYFDFYGHTVTVSQYHAVVLVLELAIGILILVEVLLLFQLRNEIRSLNGKGVSREKDIRQLAIFAGHGGTYSDSPG